MTQLQNAGQLAATIIKLNAMDIEDLGTDVGNQQNYIFQFMNIALWELAKLAERAEYSDAVTISADGYVTFTKSGSPITNMFEPRTIYMPNGQPMLKRTADEAPLGWWRESAVQNIHVRGFGLTTANKLVTGNYTLKYLRYPNTITLASDPVDIEPSGYAALIKSVSSMIKLPVNSYGASEYLQNEARRSFANLTQGSISAKGTGTTGQPVGEADIAKARGL